MSKPAKQLYEFGPFRLDAAEHVLLRDGELVSLTPKAFDTLLALVQNPGHLVGKDELMKMVWPDAVVEENNLNQNISALRKVLGESADEQAYIETVPRRGYRFVVPVRELPNVTGELILAKQTRSRMVIQEEEHETGRLGCGTDGRPAQRGLLPSALTHTPTRSHSHTLQILGFGLLVGLLTAASYVWMKGPSKSAEAGVIRRSLAVLPFKSLGAEGNEEYFGLGLTDALITRLGSINQIIVRPTSAVRRYTVLEQDPVAAGRALKVESVLDGSVQKVGNRIRLTLQLVSTADGRHLWADKFDEKFTDLLTLEDSISERVASALALKLTGEERRLLVKRYTENAEAHRLYLKGRYFWDKPTEEAQKIGIGYFQQAIAVDPNYALAYSGLAFCYARLNSYGWVSSTESFPEAEKAAAKALEMDDTLAEAHAAMARVKGGYHWDWPGAEREYRRAIELNPNYATAHDFYGSFLAKMGRSDESIIESKRALELDPLSLPINGGLATSFYFSRRYDQAIEVYRKMLEMDPNYVPAHFGLGRVYLAKGMYKEAIAEYQTEKTVSPNKVGDIPMLAYAYAMSGQRTEAMKVFDHVMERVRQRYVSPFHVAIMYVGLGETDRAFEWLHKAYDDRSELVTWIKVNPTLDSLRSDPRFEDLLRRIGLTR